MSKRGVAFLEAILVIALWSSSPPLIKIVLDEFTPLQITAIRYGGACLALLPFVWMRSRNTLAGLQRREWLRLMVMGALGFTLGNSFMFFGLQTLPATTTAFLLNGIPIATVLLGAWSLGERPRWLQWIGILIALVGGVVFFGGRIELIQVNAIGLTLVGVLLLTIFGLMARGFTRSERIDPISLTALPMGFGALFLLVFIWPLPLPSWRVVGVLAWLTLINSATAFVIWNHALKSMLAFEISITGNLMPLGTALLAPIILSEPIPGSAWLGISLSLFGVVLVGIGGRPMTYKAPV